MVSGKSIQAYGRLLTLGSGDGVLNFGEFTNELVGYAHGLNELRRSIYFFTEDGGGRLSAGMAGAALEFVKSVWRDEGSLRRRVGVRKKNYNTPYSRWKKKAFGESRARVLTGTSMDSLRVLYKKNNPVIGFKQNLSTRLPIPMSHPVKYSRKKSRVADYNLVHEIGYKYQLIAPSISYWVQVNAPEWGWAVQKMLARTYEEARDKAGEAKTTKLSQASWAKKGDAPLDAPSSPAMRTLIGGESAAEIAEIREQEKAVNSVIADMNKVEFESDLSQRDIKRRVELFTIELKKRGVDGEQLKAAQLDMLSGFMLKNS